MIGKIAGARSFRETEQAEQDRVGAVIDRDKVDRAREIDRKAAELEVRAGRTVNIGGAVIEPTPEWQEQGDFRTFTPKLEQGTTATVKAYRRVLTPIVARMHAKGKLTDEQYSACVWYRNQHEAAGLIGRFKTSSLSDAGGGSGGGMGQAPMALHAFEVEARIAFRDAQQAIAPVLLKFFEAVVLKDIPVSRAKAYIRCGTRSVEPRFRAAAGDLARHLEDTQTDLAQVLKNEAD